MDEGCQVPVDLSRVEMKANMRRSSNSSSDAVGRRRSCLFRIPRFVSGAITIVTFKARGLNLTKTAGASIVCFDQLLGDVAWRM